MEKLIKIGQQKGIYYDEQDLSISLMYSDRDLFSKFRDGKLTLAQYKCRVMGRAFSMMYVVPDDLKGVINEKFLKPPDEKQRAHFEMIHGKNPSVDELLRELQTFEK